MTDRSGNHVCGECPAPEPRPPEEIVLPRSGVRLTRSRTRYGDWHLNGMAGGSLIMREGDGRWMAWWPEEKTFWGTRDACIAWYDERIVNLRAALAPPPGDADAEGAARFATTCHCNITVACGVCGWSPLDAVTRALLARDAAARSLIEAVEHALEAATDSLAACYRATGADADGNDNAVLAAKAVRTVTRICKEYDEELDKTEAEVAKLRGDLIDGVKRLVEEGNASIPAQFRTLTSPDQVGDAFRFAESEVERLRAAVIAGHALQRRHDNPGGTHYEGCEKTHVGCGFLAAAERAGVPREPRP